MRPTEKERRYDPEKESFWAAWRRINRGKSLWRMIPGVFLLLAMIPFWALAKVMNSISESAIDWMEDVYAVKVGNWAHHRRKAVDGPKKEI